MKGIFERGWSEFLMVMSQGGIALWFLLGVGVLLYGFLFGTDRTLKSLRRTVDEVQEANVMGDRRTVVRRYAIFELERVAWVERRMPLIGVLVGACTLGGLLGTVSGMLATFSGLASRVVVDPVEKISGGISEAMLTTQAGLLFAIPAAFWFGIQRARLRDFRLVLEERMRGELVRCKEVRQ